MDNLLIHVSHEHVSRVSATALVCDGPGTSREQDGHGWRLVWFLINEENDKRAFGVVRILGSLSGLLLG